MLLLGAVLSGAVAWLVGDGVRSGLVAGDGGSLGPGIGG